MKTTLHKWFWVWEFDKEEAWLDDMAAHGLALTGVGFCTYTFEDAAPGEYAIRMELLDHGPAHSESRQYIRFLEETGAEYLGNMVRWAYFRKRAESGSFDLFSDNASRIRHLNRILLLLFAVGAVNLFAALTNLSVYCGVGTRMNLACVFLSLAMTALLAYGYYRIRCKRVRLQKEQQIFE